VTVPRVGIGYDVHRLAPQRALVLGGVAIEHPAGLVGHSDGDVLLHAVMDALLGAAGLGDLGAHYPSDDERWSGADSAELVARVVALLGSNGYAAASIDVTIIAEAPRLAPHVGAMRQRIAGLLSLDPSAVNVKSKTNEGLGAIGGGEAIAALAVAVLASRAD